MKKKDRLIRVKIQYNTKEGGIYNAFDMAMIRAIESYGLLYDGSGMELAGRTRDLFFYAPKEVIRNDGKKQRIGK